MEPLRLCLLGAGRWGRRYIATIAEMSHVALAALASRNPESGALAPEGCSIHADWRDAIATKVDGVIIATPPALHAKMALAAIGMGLPVLVEKPLTLSKKEAQSIADASARNDVLVSVGHIHLHNNGYRGLKGRLNEIGSLRHIHCVAGNWGPFRPDVTPLWDWAPHDLSMCLDLAGRAAISVTCETDGFKKIDGGWAANYRLKLDFGSMLTATIDIGNMMEVKSRFIEVVGDRGRLSYDDISQRLLFTDARGERQLPVEPGAPLSQQIDAFAASVRRGVKRDPGLSQGVEIVGILENLAAAVP
jgi:predicted dehydrogenase